MKLLRLQGSLYGADEWVSRFTGERVEGKEGREAFQCRAIQEASQISLFPVPSSWVLACYIQVFFSDTKVQQVGSIEKPVGK